ncbi:hypothetical protein BD413DRAFT_268296 [Trametes elegans]|nr:hypothetical protein BD413DRAFT_268296 [Trametes elegans]
MNRYLNGDCLLPNLHTLAFSVSSPHETALLTVVSPSLRKLDIYFAFEARLGCPHLRQKTAVDTLFQTAFTYTPGVRDLMMHMCEFSPTPLLCTAGSRLKHLRRLDLSRSVDIADEGTLRTLADI